MVMTPLLSANMTMRGGGRSRGVTCSVIRWWTAKTLSNNTCRNHPRGVSRNVAAAAAFSTHSQGATTAAAAATARVLLVGTGRMGKIRASILHANPRFDLVGIVDDAPSQGVADGPESLSTTYHVSHTKSCIT